MFELFSLIDSMGAQEMLIVGILAILLFGERLPEVARKIGKQLNDFRRSVRGIQEEFTGALSGIEHSTGSYSSTSSSRSSDDLTDESSEATAPKFVPPPKPPHPSDRVQNG